MKVIALFALLFVVFMVLKIYNRIHLNINPDIPGWEMRDILEGGKDK